MRNIFKKKFLKKNKEEKKISKDILFDHIFSILILKENLKLIPDHEKIFYQFKDYLDYKEASDVFYFENLHPIFNDFFSKFEYVKLDDNDGEVNRSLVCYHPDYDNEEYIKIAHEYETDYIVKKNSTLIDETEAPYYYPNFNLTIFSIISLSIISILYKRDNISFDEYKKVLREMEQIPYIRKSVDE